MLPNAIGKEEVAKLTFRNPPLPFPGRKSCTAPAQQCSDERPQLHLQQSTVSFPCLVHKVGAQTDAKTPLRLPMCTLPALTHVHTLISSPVTCFAQPMHLQKACAQILHPSCFHKLSAPQMQALSQ